MYRTHSKVIYNKLLHTQIVGEQHNYYSESYKVTIGAGLIYFLRPVQSKYLLCKSFTVFINSNFTRRSSNPRKFIMVQILQLSKKCISLLERQEKLINGYHCYIDHLHGCRVHFILSSFCHRISIRKGYTSPITQITLSIEPC